LANDLIEPAAVPEYFITGTGYIDDLGDGNRRFALCAPLGKQRIILLKVVISTPNIYLQMQQTMLHLGYKCCGGQRSRVGMN
jgi:hypothetical protein